MKKIALYNNKGGVGKTTSVINIAYTLSQRGKRVLVVDCDTQQNACSFLSEKPLVENVESTRYQNLDIMSLAHTSDLDSVEQVAASYDCILLDMPPALNDTTHALLSKCDGVIVPIELGVFALQGIANVTRAIAETPTPFIGCFVSKYDNHNSADVDMLEIVRKEIGTKLFDTQIPQSKIIKNSISYRLTAAEYMGWLAPAKAYEMLADEIQKRI